MCNKLLVSIILAAAFSANAADQATVVDTPQGAPGPFAKQPPTDFSFKLNIMVSPPGAPPGSNTELVFVNGKIDGNKVTYTVEKANTGARLCSYARGTSFTGTRKDDGSIVGKMGTGMCEFEATLKFDDQNKPSGNFSFFRTSGTIIPTN